MDLGKGLPEMDLVHFNDPGCPWGYSASPALAALRWRYGDGLSWRLAMIGLAERAEDYAARGYEPVWLAKSWSRRFRGLGMPIQTAPGPYVPGTGRACRAVVATRLIEPERELEAFRALQFGWFAAPLVLDRDDHIRTALARVAGLDATRIVEALDDPAVEEAYQADRAEARTAAGGAAERQGKTARTDGPVRYSAPTLVFGPDGGREVRLPGSAGLRRAEAGGWQPVEAYDVLIANLAPELSRRPPPESPLDALAEAPGGLVTQEIAAVMSEGNDPPDRLGVEDRLIELAAERLVRRVPLGNDALWVHGEEPEFTPAAVPAYAAGAAAAHGA